MTAIDADPPDVADSAGVKVPPPLLYAGAFALGMLLQKFAPLRRREARLAGAGLVAGGVTLLLWTRLLFLQRGTTILPTRSVSLLVEDGPFRISRNPIYVGLTATYLGASLLRRSVWPLILLPGVVIVMQKAVINREESYLERRFGEEYLDYKDRVRRWL